MREIPDLNSRLGCKGDNLRLRHHSGLGLSLEVADLRKRRTYIAKNRTIRPVIAGAGIHPGVHYAQ